MVGEFQKVGRHGSSAMGPFSQLISQKKMLTLTWGFVPPQWLEASENALPSSHTVDSTGDIREKSFRIAFCMMLTSNITRCITTQLQKPDSATLLPKVDRILWTMIQKETLNYYCWASNSEIRMLTKDVAVNLELASEPSGSTFSLYSPDHLRLGVTDTTIPSGVMRPRLCRSNDELRPNEKSLTDAGRVINSSQALELWERPVIHCALTPFLILYHHLQLFGRAKGPPSQHHVWLWALDFLDHQDRFSGHWHFPRAEYEQGVCVQLRVCTCLMASRDKVRSWELFIKKEVKNGGHPELAAAAILSVFNTALLSQYGLQQPNPRPVDVRVFACVYQNMWRLEAKSVSSSGELHFIGFERPGIRKLLFSDLQGSAHIHGKLSIQQSEFRAIKAKGRTTAWALLISTKLAHRFSHRK
ncbi:hypothetical protein U0070_013597 [Myodes glareolus]|uniref:Uncharacterized protein n=1 Tax=Myodes glareolus TaxID=447135 RepID=A0AAW0JNY7_MYOGA